MNMLRAAAISLPRSADRRNLVARNLREWQVPWLFFDALAGDAPCAIPENHQRQITGYKRRLTSNELGCFKSHYKVLADFVAAQDTEWLMVLEDDVWIDTMFDFAKAITELERRGIHYMRLFAKSYKNADVLDTIDGRELLRFRTNPIGSQAYLISRKAAERFLASVQSIDTAIDHEMGRFWVNGLDNYALFPFPVTERAVPSTIGHETEEEMSLRSPPPFWPRMSYRTKGYIGKRVANARFLLSRHHS
jgi:glycosyl transferase family 25